MRTHYRKFRFNDMADMAEFKPIEKETKVIYKQPPEFNKAVSYFHSLVKAFIGEENIDKQNSLYERIKDTHRGLMKDFNADMDRFNRGDTDISNGELEKIYEKFDNDIKKFNNYINNNFNLTRKIDGLDELERVPFEKIIMAYTRDSYEDIDVHELDEILRRSNVIEIEDNGDFYDFYLERKGNKLRIGYMTNVGLIPIKSFNISDYDSIDELLNVAYQYAETEAMTPDTDKLTRNSRYHKKHNDSKYRKRHRDSEDLFYGVPGVEFIWHGEWSDPEVRYKEYLLNYYDLENSLWEEFKEITEPIKGEKEEVRIDSETGEVLEFGEWIRANTDTVYDDLEAFIRDGVAEKEELDLMQF